jgi:hypothetical protein
MEVKPSGAAKKSGYLNIWFNLWAMLIVYERSKPQSLAGFLRVYGAKCSQIYVHEELLVYLQRTPWDCQILERLSCFVDLTPPPIAG